LTLLEVVIEDDRWNGLDLEARATRAISVALHHLGLTRECEISVLGTDDARIARLNEGFRDKASATNVLSWPAVDLAPDQPGERPAAPEMDFTGEIALGDIAISFDTCAREAQDAAKSMEDHVTHLIIHGLLHLLGYDHIRDPDATLMEATEVEILGILGLDDPYKG